MQMQNAKKILLSPHNDDEALFASFICMREKPLVVIVTDSCKQFNRGGNTITAERRRQESVTAMRALGCSVVFLEMPDSSWLSWKKLHEKLKQFHPEVVYAPAIQGGHIQHDVVGIAALAHFPHVVQYATYALGKSFTTGDIEIVPTPEELTLKDRALDCYQSQITYERTAHFFEAVRGKSEWVMKPDRCTRCTVLWHRSKWVMKYFKGKLYNLWHH